MNIQYKLKSTLQVYLALMILTIGFTAQGAEEFTQEEINSSPYLQSVLKRKGEQYDTSKFRKPGPYRIAIEIGRAHV